MIAIEHEHRPEVLRQIALLLERENRHLHDRIKKLTLELGRLQGADAASLQLEIDQLQEMLERRERALFAASSEKRPHQCNGAEAERAPHTGHGPTPQPQLPVVEETHELAPEERGCTVCGGTLEPMGDQAEESEEITVVERQFVLKKRRCRKYRCRCNAAVVTAPAPPRLIPGGRYAPEFAVEVAIDKYLDHLPLERQSRIMAREGLQVSSQTLWDQIHALARVLEPSYKALRPLILEAPVIHADETHWPLMTRQGSSKWWVWSVASREAVYYQLAGTRSHKAAQSLLSGYEGVVMCDGYTAYETVAARAGPKMKLAHCWAHARRKFVEAEPNYPQECERPIALIGKLFKIERKVPRVLGPEPKDVLDLRRELRTEHSKPLVQTLGEWAHETAPQVLPRSGIGKAVRYLQTYWTGLTRFLEDPHIPLDNNLAERELRGVVVGRKNHYGSRSKAGTEVAAILYSLVETAKLTGAEPRAYLLQATRAALEEPGTVTLPRQHVH